MGDFAPLPTIPPGAIPIVRSSTLTGTLYTVPTGRLLHIVTYFGKLQAASGGGAQVATALITHAIQFDASQRTPFDMSAAIGTVENLVTAQLDVPVPAGNITLTIVGSPTAATIGFIGWEEAL